HVFTLLQQQFGEFVVGPGRCYDAQPIARRGGFGNGIESLHAVFLRDLPRSVRDHIVNADELDESTGCEFGVDAGVFPAERTDSEDSDFDSGIVWRSSAIVRGSHAPSLPPSTDH